MAVTAKARAQTALRAQTTLAPEAVLGVVKQAAGSVRGGGASLLTTGIQNVGAQVHVERETPGELRMSITSGKRVVELCTFSAMVKPHDGGTSLTVGGLDTYKTTQQAILGFIPAGPKMIAGFSPYKRFLDQVASALRAADTAANVRIGGEA